MLVSGAIVAPCLMPGNGAENPVDFMILRSICLVNCLFWRFEIVICPSLGCQTILFRQPASLCFLMTETRLTSFDDRFGARGNLQLAEDIGHLIADGFGTQGEFFGNSGVG
jgi:hypothetical protein